MRKLRGKFIWHSPSDRGDQAIIDLIEPNGDPTRVRCLCLPEGTTEIGDPSGGPFVAYLNELYGDQMVCRTARATTLGHLT